MNEDENRAYLCDAGTLGFIEGPASDIVIEPNDSESLLNARIPRIRRRSH